MSHEPWCERLRWRKADDLDAVDPGSTPGCEGGKKAARVEVKQDEDDAGVT